MTTKSLRRATARRSHFPSDERIEELINARDMAAARRAIDLRLKASAEDADALFYSGACAMVAKDFAGAEAEFAAAAAARPQEARFLSARAAACLAALKPEEAMDHAEAALALAPEDTASLVNLLQALIRQKKFEAALTHAESLARKAPDLPEARQLMGEVLRGLSRFPAAMSWFEAALEVAPDDPRPRVDIAICISHMGDPRAALTLVNKLLETLPEDADALSRLGIRAQEGGSPHLALQFFKRGFSLFSNDLTLCVNLGITVQGMGNPGESLFYFRRALDLDAETPVAWFFAGNAYQALRQNEDAERCYERCLEYDPKHSGALTHLAGLRKEKGKVDEAKDLLRKAIEHDEKWLPPYINLYGFLKEAGEFEEAEEILDRADLLDPDSMSLRQARADLQLRRGDITGANAIFREILAKEGQNPDAISGLLFCSNYDPELTPEQIADAYKSWDRRFLSWRAPPPGFKYANKPDAKRRIKLGYVSGDLRGHSVAFFAEPLLANHDHEAFEVYCYANQKNGDATTGRMMKMADHWRWAVDLSDDALVEMIRLDAIDILIDLSNHTAYHRLYMFGRKPAPIQMTTIGMPTTTGLSAIDYRITDAMMDPVGMTEHLHSEKLLRIASHWCYRPSDEAVDLPVAEAPALKNGFLSFASFNAFGKINPRVFTLWGRLLEEIPDALLYVATGGKDNDEVLNAQVKKTCAECGVPVERLRLMGRKPFKAYCEFHSEIDIVLDSFPYTGATVTAHALWMGVPVITLAGPSPIHRSATSMITSVGLPEFVAQTQDEYVAIAKRWAGDIPTLAEIRRRLRSDMQASPLMDGPLVTKDLEAGLRRIWQEWCKSQKPQRKRRVTHG